jgi:hypothetical protein
MEKDIEKVLAEIEEIEEILKTNPEDCSTIFDLARKYANIDQDESACLYYDKYIFCI